MAFDGFGPVGVAVVGNDYGRPLRRKGNVKARDRLALMFGYASIGVGVGVLAAMVASLVQPGLVALVAIVSLCGAVLLARSAARKLHWGALALVVAMHLSAMTVVASMFVPELAGRILPVVFVFGAVLTALAMIYGRWFTAAMNMSLQALLLSMPIGAALTHAFFHRGF